MEDDEIRRRNENRRCRNCANFPCTKHISSLNNVCEDHEYLSERMIKEIDKKAGESIGKTYHKQDTK